jgi:uncharacterized protein with PhoU and TrkA domain
VANAAQNIAALVLRATHRHRAARRLGARAAGRGHRIGDCYGLAFDTTSTVPEASLGAVALWTGVNTGLAVTAIALVGFLG